MGYYILKNTLSDIRNLPPAQAVELDPENPTCHIGKGTVLVELKQYAAAVLSFREAYARRRSYAVYKGMLRVRDPPPPRDG
jgi:hypothetical protein